MWEASPDADYSRSGDLSHHELKDKMKQLFSFEVQRYWLIICIFKFLFSSPLCWAQGTRLAICRAVAAVPVDIVTPSVGKQQIAPDTVIAGAPVTLVIGLFDDNWNPVALNHTCQLDIVNSEAVPFLAEDHPTSPGSQRTIQLPKTITLNNPVPGVGTFQVYPFRATIYQDSGLTPDITQYRFVVKDLSDPAVLPDTSFPLDSVIPEPLAKLILVLPGEMHYPGSFLYFIANEPPRLGLPLDLFAGFNYEFIVYGTDRFGNTVPGRPADLVGLERDRGLLYPETPTPYDKASLDEIANGISIAKRMFVVRYAGTGRAWLRTISTTIPPSLCREFSILYSGIEESHRKKLWGPSLNIYPNPFIQHTVIRYSLNENQKNYTSNDLRLMIHDISGRLIRKFPIHDFQFTTHEVTWNGRDKSGKKVSSGIYFCVLETPDFKQIEKLVILK